MILVHLSRFRAEKFACLLGKAKKLHMPISWRLQHFDGTNWITDWNVVLADFYDREDQHTFNGSVDNRTTGAKRYWRLRGSYSDNASYLHLAELEMRQSVGGADVTTTGFAIKGAERGGSFVAENALDNIISGDNSWGVQLSVTDLVDRWVGQDFGSANDKEVVEVQVTARADSSPDQNLNNFFIEASTDNITWNPVWYVEDAGAAWASSEARVFTNPDALDTLRLDFENGTNGNQDATDDSPAATALTWVGSSQVTNVQVARGSLALDINADTLSGDALQIPTIAFGTTNEFTIECYAYSTYNDGTWYHSAIGNFQGGSANSWSLFVQDSPNNRAYFIVDGDTNTGPGTTDLDIGAWQHLAITRDSSGVWRLFVDGQQEATVTDATVNLGGTGTISIGGNNAGANDEWRGYIDMVRITEGLARYTTNFIPPDIF